MYFFHQTYPLLDLRLRIHEHMVNFPPCYQQGWSTFIRQNGQLHPTRSPSPHPVTFTPFHLTKLFSTNFFFFLSFYLRKQPQVEGNDICKKEPKVKPTEIDLKIITEKPKETQTNGCVKTSGENEEKIPELNKIATKLPKGSENYGFVEDEDSKGNEKTKETWK